MQQQTVLLQDGTESAGVDAKGGGGLLQSTGAKAVTDLVRFGSLAGPQVNRLLPVAHVQPVDSLAVPLDDLL
ncbi:hypothetical protein, partial [Streptomyces niveus]|uniref:hypothetical protein n=1 Tax=Streptomyces niveus TaxID=193462 RepID=UPI00343CF84B